MLAGHVHKETTAIVNTAFCWLDCSYYGHVDDTSHRLFRGLHCERFHAWPILDGVLLGICLGFRREEARDPRRPVGHRGAVVDVRFIL